ncbi:hypothetical protein PR048_027137 [Dryococelus australis]|uniref:Uncharacterized protein n=1 Tax=Dryococelus australis TaxID=614101 RepID=A0ABQ9GG66_9NEOP|nr:hypothetical protein PR048_027137 [Dryococelus australis]
MRSNAFQPGHCRCEYISWYERRACTAFTPALLNMKCTSPHVSLSVLSASGIENCQGISDLCHLITATTWEKRDIPLFYLKKNIDFEHTATRRYRKAAPDEGVDETTARPIPSRRFRKVNQSGRLISPAVICLARRDLAPPPPLVFLLVYPPLHHSATIVTDDWSGPGRSTDVQKKLKNGHEALETRSVVALILVLFVSLSYVEPPHMHQKHLVYRAARNRGRVGRVVRLLASNQGEPRSVPGRVTPRIFACENRARMMPLVDGFSRGSQFSLDHLLSGAAPFSPHFTSKE